MVQWGIISLLGSEANQLSSYLGPDIGRHPR